MNKQQRAQIDELVTRLEQSQSVVQDTDYDGMTCAEALNVVIGIEGDIEGIQSEIQELQSDEQDKFDNMPEGLQEGDRGQAIQAAADNLQEADQACDDVITEIHEACHFLQALKDKGEEDKPVPEDDHNELTQDVADKIQCVVDYLVEAQA